jgi:zinc D-Ala-D-Ala carboxypeptidase
MKLTKNFYLYEFTRSQTASRKGIRNVPNEAQTVALRLLCEKVLQPVRDHFGKSVEINSGLRVPELNAAVGGSKTSQHTKGEAADIEIWGVPNLKLAEWIRDNLDFDQLILEFYDASEGPNSGWVHVSYRGADNRREVLTKLKGVPGYDRGLPPEPKP